jgi:hypothetical protein
MKAMSGTIKLALAVLIALFVFGGIALLGVNSQHNANNGSTSRNSSPNPNATQDKDVAATITYTGTGFEPNLATIQVNKTIRVRNRSIRVLKFVSDPYPTQTDEPELNIGTINPGESKTLYISQKGTWGYHNALDASETGRLIVPN